MAQPRTSVGATRAAAAAAALLVALCCCNASAPFRTLSPAQYLQYRQSPQPPAPAPAPAPSSGASPPRRSSIQLHFIPSFQGTLLSNAHADLPLFLAPLSPHSYQHVYRQLLSRTTAVVPDEHAVEYAAITCHADGSHFSHCLSLPAAGAVAQLRQKYHVRSLPYDWRQSKRTILRSPFAQQLAHALQCEHCLVLAHGSACPLLRLAIDRHVANVSATSACIAPITARVANLTSAGEGLMRVGDAHKFADCMSSVRRANIQYGSMAAELGMLPNRRGRSHIPHVSGLDFAQPPMVAVEKRRALATAFDAMAHLASGGEALVHFCVEGTGFEVQVAGARVDGDGVVERGACDGVARRVLRVPAAHLDLVRLVDAIVHQLAAPGTAV